MAQARENWGSKIGVIFAVAGSAIGIGNFLKFPVEVATNGGGAFLIPYFISFILLGIPLAWIEWTLGRYGGIRGVGSEPGVLALVTKKSWFKYIGSLGILAPLLIFFAYIYIESWLLGFTWFSLTGQLQHLVQTNTLGQFFGDYISLKYTVGGIPVALIMFLLTFVINFIITFAGVQGGIEKFSKIAMPLILIIGVFLLFRVLTISGIQKGFAFLWNPDLSRLSEPKMWLAACGQIFFTLSLGSGAIVAYASYVKKNEDIALSSLTANATNEFAEVILGGTIVVPLAIVLFGADIQEIAKLGTIGLGFQTLPVIFSKLPLSQILQTLWFFLLFFAGVTSSISLSQPGITFFQDELGMSRKNANLFVLAIAFVMCLFAVFGFDAGAFDEMWFWGGTFLLVLVGAIESIVFSCFWGVDTGWKELHEGSNIKVPKFYKFILKYITPLFLVTILIWWFSTDFINTITLKGMDPKAMTSFLSIPVTKVGFIMFTRVVFLSLLAGLNILIFIGWKRKMAKSHEPI